MSARENNIIKLHKLLTENHFSDEASRFIVTELDSIGFFEAPASTKYHGAYEGGLFDHSYTVAVELMNLTKQLELKWEMDRSPIIIGIFHDLCKCDSYVKNDDHYEYRTDLILDGHGYKSIVMAQRIVDLSDEEMICIRWHMGAYETDTKLWGYYGRAIEKFPNVLYTHTADMIASKIEGV